MKSYKDFLTEKKAFSPRGQAMREKMRSQNDKNRAAKFGPAEKGGALVKQKQETGNKVQPQQVGNPRNTPKRPPGVSSTTQTTTARTGQDGGQLMAPKDRQKLQKKREKAQKKENKKLDQKAQEIYNKKNSGAVSGIKSALGGDLIGSAQSKSKGKLASKYNAIAKEKQRDARTEAGKNLAKGAVNTVKDGVGRVLRTKTGGQPGVSHGTPIV